MSFLSRGRNGLDMTTRSPKTRPPIPVHTPVTSEVHLPFPATQHPRPTVAQNTSRFRAFSECATAVKEYVRRTLAAPYVPTGSPLLETSTEHFYLLSTPSKDCNDQPGDDEVDAVIVDRVWSEDFESESNSDAAETASSRHNGTAADVAAVALDDRPEGVWTLPPLAFTRRKVWPRIAQFYMPRFADEADESMYQREVWGQSKRLSLWSSVFFIASCILAILTIQSPVVIADKIFYFGVAPLLSVPLLFMCAYNWPYEHSFIFQTVLCMSAWSWPFYEILYAYLCGFYERNPYKDRPFTCGSKDFLSTFYYTAALQAVAMFGTSLKRLPATIGAVVFLIFSCVTIIPLDHAYSRNVINFVIFQCVLLYMHSQKENSSRKLFWLRTQLKAQVQRTRKAQVNERQAADSKRRLTSYVFHEVRVPLNTALLAVQNMASRPIARDHEVEFNALEGSLSMMSKVLNDVLDFNRMDSGQLETLSRPYAFHKVLRSLFIPLRLAADARKLQFVTDLDPRIDEVARRAAYQSMPTPEVVSERLSGELAPGMVVGDETRLRQIITNLASNACKFTPAGGKLTITTRLVIPAPTSPPPSPRLPSNGRPSTSNTLTTAALSLHNESNPPSANITKQAGMVDRIVVRIEVSDTGSGIDMKDMKESRLFSAFNQTEQGRTQGGKGTGLGLALVRQIVKLGGGRLGVRSKVGVGSTFWIELPLVVGKKAMESPLPPISPSVSRETTVRTSSGSRVAEAVEVGAIVAQQSPTAVTRSNSALQSLMDQGGRFELMLAKYDSHSPMPTRTLGDPSTGTDYEYPLSSPEDEPPSPLPPALTLSKGSSETLRAGANMRPTFVSLKDARFALETRSPTPSPPTPVIPSSTQSAPPTGMRVLVVDDDAMTRMLMSRMLQRLGCKVSTAENGEVALQRILGLHSPCGSAEHPDVVVPDRRFAVIFLDNQMPKLSGVKLVERLRQLGRSDFVVGVTGNALVDDQKEYLDAGADHVLTKPVLEVSLRKMLNLAEERTHNS